MHFCSPHTIFPSFTVLLFNSFGEQRTYLQRTIHHLVGVIMGSMNLVVRGRSGVRSDSLMYCPHLVRCVPQNCLHPGEAVFVMVARCAVRAHLSLLTPNGRGTRGKALSNASSLVCLIRLRAYVSPGRGPTKTTASSFSLAFLSFLSFWDIRDWLRAACVG